MPAPVVDVRDEFEPGERFPIGSERAEHLVVNVLSRSRAEDYWDGNWLACEIRVSAGGFRGRFEANLRTDELERFARQVRTLYDDLKTSAKFEPMEEQLWLELQGDGRGHIHCIGRARDVASGPRTCLSSTWTWIRPSCLVLWCSWRSF